MVKTPSGFVSGSGNFNDEYQSPHSTANVTNSSSMLMSSASIKSSPPGTPHHVDAQSSPHHHNSGSGQSHQQQQLPPFSHRFTSHPGFQSSATNRSNVYTPTAAAAAAAAAYMAAASAGNVTSGGGASSGGGAGGDTSTVWSMGGDSTGGWSTSSLPGQYSVQTRRLSNSASLGELNLQSIYDLNVNNMYLHYVIQMILTCPKSIF